MKQPKRNKKIFTFLDEITDILKFYMSDEASAEYIKKINHIKDEFKKLSMDKKVNNVKLFKEWKHKLAKDDSDE